MVLDIHLSDPHTGIKAKIVDGEKEHALVVATRPLKTFTNDVKFFENVDYGIDMNSNGSFGGVPVKVHNGIDSVLWTGTNIVDRVNFHSADRNHTLAGNRSIKFSSWSNSGDVCQIAKGSDQDLTNYTALTMWININNNYASGDSVSVYGWDTSTSSIVGSKAYLENYCVRNEEDVWQQIIIPLDNMNLTGKTLDSIRFQYETKDGTATNFYIDDIQWEETGTPIKYTIKPDNGTWLYVEELTFLIANNIPGTLENATLPFIAYDSILGLQLPSGVLYQRKQNNKILFSTVLRNVGDFLQIAGTRITGSGSDGVNTWVTFSSINPVPFILKPELEDEVSFIVQDDMTSLLKFRSSAGCKVEQR